MLGALGSIIGGISGILGNRSASKGMKQGMAMLGEGAGWARGINRQMAGLYGGAMQAGLFDYDRRIGKMYALDKKFNEIPAMQSAAQQLYDYQPGDTPRHDVARAIAADAMERRDRAADEIRINDLMARMGILQGSLAPAQMMMGAGQAQFGMAQSQQQNLSSLIPSIASGLKGIFK